MRIHVVDVATGQVANVDKALNWLHGNLAGFRVSWSADSRWMAYSRDLPNSQNAIFIYDARTGGAPHQVTSGYYNDRSPSFDPDGKYLYFLSGRTFAPSYSDLDNSWAYVNSTNIVVVPLRADVPSPLAPRSDEEGAAAEAMPTRGQGRRRHRLHRLRAARRSASRRRPATTRDSPRSPAACIYRRGVRTGAAQGPTPIVSFELSDREEKTIVDNALGFVTSADGKKLLVRNAQDWFIIDPKPAQKLDKKLATATMSMTVDPSAEWHQMFNDAWRIERDYFYDPGMHGVDWNAMRSRYGKLIDDAVSRWDVSFVLGELIGELNSSHTYVQGGQYENGPRRNIGLLGADFALEGGYFCITKIYDGGEWDSEVRSPLKRPGIKVSEGDYLLAVNGKPLDPTKDVGASFEGLANAVVSITVNDKPTLAGARTVLVKPLADESRLRNLAWIESNRKRVDEETHGRVGYVYVPNTGVDGQTELVRQYRAQTDKDGMIIDERFNSGGQIPDRFVELLDRPIESYWKTRDGVPQQTPPIANSGPEGDAHQRVERLGRRRLPVLLQASAASAR